MVGDAGLDVDHHQQYVGLLAASQIPLLNRSRRYGVAITWDPVDYSKPVVPWQHGQRVHMLTMLRTLVPESRPGYGFFLNRSP